MPHTPGPWILGGLRGGNRDIDAEDVCIATVHSEGDRDANALLIAAAPDLRHAASVALGDLLAQGLGETSTARTLLAALVKAEKG